MQYEHDDTEEITFYNDNRKNQTNDNDTKDMEISIANNTNTHHMNEFINIHTPVEPKMNDKSPGDKLKMYKTQYFTASIKMPTVCSEVNVAARLIWFWTILKKIDEDMSFIPHDVTDGEEKLL